MSKLILNRLAAAGKVFRLKEERELALTRPMVMGVLNVTPDSFSDGRKFLNVSDAVEHALAMEKEGADIIDIGGESSRPGSEPVTAQREMERVLPVIAKLRRYTAIPISIDTYKAATARAALAAGADIVNDISALRFDPDMTEVVARARVPVVLMHMLGRPRDMQDDPSYDDCVAEIGDFFEERIAWCTANGIDQANIIIDPGIGFGKRLSDNLEILSRLESFKKFSVPLMVGASRKSFIGMLQQSDKPAMKRVGGSIAAAVTAVLNGADIVRAHDLEQTVEALRVVEAVRKGL
jgi:dihydropteroate synthase